MLEKIFSEKSYPPVSLEIFSEWISVFKSNIVKNSINSLIDQIGLPHRMSKNSISWYGIRDTFILFPKTQMVLLWTNLKFKDQVFTHANHQDILYGTTIFDIDIDKSETEELMSFLAEINRSPELEFIHIGKTTYKVTLTCMSIDGLHKKIAMIFQKLREYCKNAWLIPS